MKKWVLFFLFLSFPVLAEIPIELKELIKERKEEYLDKIFADERKLKFERSDQDSYYWMGRYHSLIALEMDLHFLYETDDGNILINLLNHKSQNSL